jgi:hypothetical protein
MEETPSRAIWIVAGVTTGLLLVGAITAWVLPYLKGVLPG